MTTALAHQGKAPQCDSDLTELVSAGSHVACVVDGRQASRMALILAGQVASAIAGRLSVVHVDTTPTIPLVLPCGCTWIPDVAADEADLRSWLDRLTAHYPGAARVLLHGELATELSNWANREQPDLLLIGERRRGRIGRLLFGDPISRVRRGVLCPVVEISAELVAALSEPDATPSMPGVVAPQMRGAVSW